MVYSPISHQGEATNDGYTLFPRVIEYCILELKKIVLYFPFLE